MTAPAGFVPKAIIRKGNTDTVIHLPADDSFLKSINHFKSCIEEAKLRNDRYTDISKQAELVDEFKRQAGWK